MRNNVLDVAAHMLELHGSHERKAIDLYTSNLILEQEHEFKVLVVWSTNACQEWVLGAFAHVKCLANPRETSINIFNAG